jgi:hypothetical protein
VLDRGNIVRDGLFRPAIAGHAYKFCFVQAFDSCGALEMWWTVGYD